MLLNPVPILQKEFYAKREWRIATSLLGRSASRSKPLRVCYGTSRQRGNLLTTCPVGNEVFLRGSADALREIIGGKIGAGSLFSKISLKLA